MATAAASIHSFRSINIANDMAANRAYERVYSMSFEADAKAPLTHALFICTTPPGQGPDGYDIHENGRVYRHTTTGANICCDFIANAIVELTTDLKYVCVMRGIEPTASIVTPP